MGFFDNILSFFKSVAAAEFDFKMLGDFFNGFFNNLASNASIADLWSKITGALASVAVVVPLVLILLSLVEAFFGKKLINIQKFLAAALIGYCAGVTYIAPLIDKINFQLPAFVSGIVIALVAAVLSKFLYIALYVLAAGYSVYLVSFSGMLVAATKDSIVISLVAAAVAIILALVLRKYIEMLGTSLLGGYFLSKSIIALYDYRTLGFLGEFGWVAELVLIALIGILGFIVQYKTRTRY